MTAQTNFALIGRSFRSDAYELWLSSRASRDRRRTGSVRAGTWQSSTVTREPVTRRILTRL